MRMMMTTVMTRMVATFSTNSTPSRYSRNEKIKRISRQILEVNLPRMFKNSTHAEAELKKTSYRYVCTGGR